MLIAASSRCFSDLSFYEACQQLTDLGFDSIELWLSEETPHLRPSHVAEDPDRFVRRFNENSRLTPLAVHLNEDPGETTFQRICHLCNLLQVAQVTIPSAEVGTPFNEEIDRLRQRLDTATGHGLRLSMKIQQGRLTEDPQTAAELCQSVAGLGLTLDLSPYLCGKYAHISHECVYPYVYHVHLRDASPQAFQVPMGLGEVDCGRLISQLRRRNYNRVLSVEIYPELLGGADRGLELRKTRMLLESLL
ncbi:MAG: hypothetical protein KatS3mg113_1012 [Planctomycetaceae bacterium]|nr:MAG: hypothetical protein KatS3mg113_1012 [Planctomycetaceae bacterium]